MPPTCLVADDEPLVRERLARLATREGLDVVPRCADGEEALAAVVARRPRIAFVDVRMPGLSGLDVLERLAARASPPACVLVTAHEEHVVAAFALAAVDYLLKPVSPVRFRAAVARARETLAMRDAAAQLARLRSVRPPAAPATVTLRDGPRLVRFALGDIVRAEACDDYATVHVNGREHLLAVRLAALERALPDPPFARCHRSHLVNLERVDAVLPAPGGRLLLDVGGWRVPVSRPRAPLVRSRLAEVATGDAGGRG